MKLKALMLALVSAYASQASAGTFVTLTNGNGTTLCAFNARTCPAGGLVNGVNNPTSDPYYIQTTSATYLSGYNDLTTFADGGTGKVVASSINYQTTGSDARTGSLTLLDWHKSDNVPLLAGVPQATIYDFVYRDSYDGSLVFGSRFLNQVDNNQEFNFTYRYGFTGVTASVAWTYSTDSDLHLYQAGRTADFSYAANVAYNADAIRLKGDYSVSEGNPWSALDMVKANGVTAYTFQNNALGFYQAGQEGQAIVGNKIAGYAPTTIGNGVASGSTTYAYGGTYGSAGTNSTVSGTLNIKSGDAVFNDNVAVTNGGVINAASGASVTFNGEFNQQVGAVLSGGGTFVFNGGYSAGNSPGAVTIDGQAVFGSTNTSLFEIAGTTLGTQYDHLTVNGLLTFGGALNVVFLNGFTATAGQTFDLFDFTSVQGTFSSISLAGLGTGLVWNTSNLYVNGTISVDAVVVPVPEPENYALMMLGLSVIASMVRRQKKA